MTKPSEADRAVQQLYENRLHGDGHANSRRSGWARGSEGRSNKHGQKDSGWSALASAPKLKRFALNT